MLIKYLASVAANDKIDHIIEDDSLALLSIKKEIYNLQRTELLKLQEVLLELQKEFDGLYTSNNLNDRTLKEIEVFSVTTAM